MKYVYLHVFVNSCLQLLVYTYFNDIILFKYLYTFYILAFLEMGKLFFQFNFQVSVCCDYLIGTRAQCSNMFDAKGSS